MIRIIVICVFLVFSGYVWAETAIFSPTDDTFIDESLSTTVNGSSAVMIVRSIYKTSYELDSLLKFDLSSISNGNFINSAKLNLYFFYYNDDNPSGNPLEAHRLISTWSEGTTNWNNQPGYTGSITDTVSCPGSYGWIQWNVISDVQDFVDGTRTNYGWQIINTSPTGNSMIYFRSQDYGDPDFRPYLTVEYGTIYVDESAAGANNGTSWTDAYLKLQDALSTAVAGDEIWVTQGTYRPDAGGGKIMGDRAAYFQLINGVELYGGFAGGEMSLDQRYWENNVTILSGDIGIADNNSDNSYHVVTGSSTDSTALIDGFTITQGNANGDFTWRHGGGMYIVDGNPTVRNCIFTLNNSSTDGGGMYTFIANPIVINCSFIENTAVREGGGLCNRDFCDPSVLKCTFSNNAADFGAGMSNYRSNPTIVNCFFNNNYASDDGGAVFNDESSSPVLLNCTFVNNSASDLGGGISNRGDNESPPNDSCPTVINCSFSNNSADSSGGGMNTDNAAQECAPTVTNCIFWGNTAGFGTVQDQQIDGDSSVVTYSCIQDSNADDGLIPFGGAANNNIDDNPLFRDSSDLRLSGDSPCIETGNNAAVPADTTDLDQNGNIAEQVALDMDLRSRFVDGDCDGAETVDMGAYELIWVYLGDLDNDCDVDFDDFGVFSSNWLAGK